MANVQTNFTAGSFGGGSKKAAVKAAAAPAPAPEVSSSNEVPEGTATEILDWVGSDPGRARKALHTEKKSEQPRFTVTLPLQELLENDRAAKKAAAAKKIESENK